eukprot:5582759-Prymnesium_polylepis.1
MGSDGKCAYLATNRPLRTDVKTTSSSTLPPSPGRVDILVVLITGQVPACKMDTSCTPVVRTSMQGRAAARLPADL